MRIRGVPPVQMIGLVVLALAVGVAMVWLTRTPSETTLIARWAQVYARETGNPPTDCHARPAEVPGVRLYVICKPASGAARVFLLNNRGRQVDLPSLAAAVAAQSGE